MKTIIDIPGTEDKLGDLYSGIMTKIVAKRQEKTMANAIEKIETMRGDVVGVSERLPMTPMDMLNRAVAQGADIDVLEKLMGLQERWESNQARKAFDAAMAEAKAKIPVIVKSRKVDFTSAKGRTNYQYEDLGAIAKIVDPILAQFGLSYRFNTLTEAGTVTVTCIVSHRDGHAERNTLSAAHDQSGNKNSIQAVGSTITYLQRYTLKAALGIAASNDDDARSAEPENSSITPDQAGSLREKIEEVEADLVKFCERWGIESLSELPSKKFNEALQSLTRFADMKRQRAEEQRKQANA